MEMTLQTKKVMENIKDGELALFYETMEKIQKLKLFNVGDPAYGNDFTLVTDLALLNPTFYIYEVHAGDTLVNEIIFDRHKQEFYDREIDETYTQSEVIQHVKRGLIPWYDYARINGLNDSLKEIEKLKHDLKIFTHQDVNDKHTDIISLISEFHLVGEKIIIHQIDSIIKYHEAESEEDADMLRNEFEEVHCELMEFLEDKQAALGQLTKKSGFMAKLAGLLQ